MKRAGSFGWSLLTVIGMLLLSCNKQETLLDSARVATDYDIVYYIDFQEQGTALITDSALIADFYARFAAEPVVTDPLNEDDPYLNVNYPRGYRMIYNLHFSLPKKGMFSAATTQWMQFGYSEDLDNYRFVTFTGYNYRYTRAFDASVKTYLDSLYTVHFEG